MLASISLAALAVFSYSATTLAQDVCLSAPYNALTCLGENAEAQSACADVPVQAVTITMTTTTLNVVVASTTQNVASADQVTVQITSTEKRTTTVTEGPMTTKTNIDWSTESANATVTTYVPCSLLPKSTQAAAVAEAATCNADVALPALAAITSNATLATACSCMGNPVETTTKTEYVEAPPLQTTSISVVGVAATITEYALTLQSVTETVAPETIVKVSSCTTVTSTATVSLAAPTFTAVFGPKPGCADVAKGPTKALDPKIKTMPAAADKCKALCAQDKGCKHVYVQHMYENWSGKQPHYVCEFNRDFLKPRRDLRCGKKESQFGNARGFDAKGRGV